MAESASRERFSWILISTVTTSVITAVAITVAVLSWLDGRYVLEKDHPEHDMDIKMVFGQPRPINTASMAQWNRAEYDGIIVITGELKQSQPGQPTDSSVNVFVRSGDEPESEGVVRVSDSVQRIYGTTQIPTCSVTFPVVRGEQWRVDFNISDYAVINYAGYIIPISD